MKNGSKRPVKGVKPRAREVVSPPLYLSLVNSEKCWSRTGRMSFHSAKRQSTEGLPTKRYRCVVIVCVVSSGSVGVIKRCYRSRE